MPSGFDLLVQLSLLPASTLKNRMIAKTTGDNNGAGQRIILIDALRGFALYGIILCHYNHWHCAYLDSLQTKDYGLISKMTEHLNVYFINNKFYILFSFIFGYSFYLQTVSFKKYKKNVDLLFLRRAFFLFLIGAIHFLFWFGDILFVYGILMVPLIFLRKLNNKYLLITGLLLTINIPSMLLNVYRWSHTVVTNTPAVAGAPNPKVLQFYNVVTNGSIMDNIRFNISFIHSRIQFQLWDGSFFMILGFFVFGMLAARTGILLKISTLKGKFKYIITANVAALILLHLLAHHINTPLTADSLGIKLLGFLIVFLQSIISVVTSICIVAVLVYTPLTSKLTTYLANLGRMALTNYLFQTAIGLFLFYHVGLGLYNITTPGQNFFIATGVLILQMLLSTLWLKYFKYGLIEWLLRAGTFMEFTGLRKSKPTAVLNDVDQSRN